MMLASASRALRSLRPVTSVHTGGGVHLTQTTTTYTTSYASTMSRNIRALSMSSTSSRASSSSTTTAAAAGGGAAPVMPKGLQAFFPTNFRAEEVQTGRAWRVRELRQKSATDLHKLWYVLLKERNMLHTVRLAARSEGGPMPSPERLHKVKQGMRGIRVVLGERERARREFAREDPEAFAEARSATGAVSLAEPGFGRSLRSRAQAEQLHGVVPPNLPRPGQKPRPMTKVERRNFRRALAQKRRAALAAEKAELAREMANKSDTEIDAAVDDVFAHLEGGWDMGQLPLSKRMAVREARLRGRRAPPRFDSF